MSYKINEHGLVIILTGVFEMLSYEKGEDPFEYGWEDFESKKFLVWLEDNMWIDEKIKEEFYIDNDSELFQIIDAINMGYENFNKSMGYSRFSRYLVETYNADEIAQMMMRFTEG